jgi:hypothetical protein
VLTSRREIIFHARVSQEDTKSPVEEPTGPVELSKLTWRAKRNADGTYTVRGVPILADHVAPASKKKIDAKWLKAAVEEAKTRRDQDGFRAPVHVGHHDLTKPGQDGTEEAGYFNPTGVVKAMFEGKPRDVVMADLENIPPEVFKRMREGRLPYRSVEILDVNKPSIDSLALLSTRVPYFRFKPLTVTEEAALAAVTKDGALYAEDHPDALAVASPCFDGAEIMADEAKPDAAAAPATKPAQRMAGDDWYKAALSAIAEKLGVSLPAMPAAEETPAEAPEEETAGEGAAQPAAAAAASGSGSAQLTAAMAEVAALTSWKRDQQRKETRATMIAGAKHNLEAYHLDAEDVTALEQAADLGEKAVAQYVAAIKKHKEPDTTGTLESLFGADEPKDAEGLAEFAATPDGLARAQVYSKQYDSCKTAGMLRGITREQFIRDQFGQEG